MGSVFTGRFSESQNLRFLSNCLETSCRPRTHRNCSKRNNGRVITQTLNSGLGFWYFCLYSRVFVAQTFDSGLVLWLFCFYSRVFVAQTLGSGLGLWLFCFYSRLVHYLAPLLTTVVSNCFLLSEFKRKEEEKTIEREKTRKRRTKKKIKKI